ncbi:HAMP domain-containing sensor histidine kinase [Novosphingobium sp. RD2P27]|uniref:histidine kinase n=1 Tax=Novosphingobium kalidii TaxID=3230299 RepID=A0ABV2CX48_9SPHN
MALTLQYVQTVRQLQIENRTQMDAEAASLARRYQQTGIVGLAAFLTESENRVRGYFYVLASPDGRALAGNLFTWPDGIHSPGHYTFSTDVVSSQGSTRRRAEVRVLWLEPGYRLLVGQLTETRQRLQQRYLASLAWSILGTLVVGLLLGWWLSRRALRFVETAADTGERLLAGDLSQRLPTSERHDEYDRLAEIINTCFSNLERTVEGLRTATDALAHDLKTPLTRIKSRLALTRMRKTTTAELRCAIDETEADAEGLLRSINDILALARIEGTSQQSFEPLDLASVAAEALELYRPACEERHLRVVSELRPAWIDGVRPLIDRAVANLLDNAVRHTPAHGTIRVKVEGVEGRSRITVADSGAGIPPEEHERALERFVRLDGSRGDPGTGLGLSLVQSIVRVHRGALALSDNHPGLIVDMTFPNTQKVAADR